MADLGPILRGIYEENGKLTPKTVVAAARDEDHPLHHQFEWDDAVAGERYREQQAAKLIRTVKISYTSGGESKSARAWVATYADPDVTEEPSGYLPTEDVAQDDFTRKLVLRQAEREWLSLKRRYEHLSEFMEMVQRDVAS